MTEIPWIVQTLSLFATSALATFQVYTQLQLPFVVDRHGIDRCIMVFLNDVVMARGVWHTFASLRLVCLTLSNDVSHAKWRDLIGGDGRTVCPAGGSL